MMCKLLQETVDINGACEMLGCSRTHLIRLRKAGELPYTIHARKVRFYIDGIDAYCDRQREKAFKK